MLQPTNEATLNQESNLKTQGSKNRMFFLGFPQVYVLVLPCTCVYVLVLWCTSVYAVYKENKS